MKVKGRDLSTGLPKQLTINTHQVKAAMAESNRNDCRCYKITLEKTPPETSADIIRRKVI